PLRDVYKRQVSTFGLGQLLVHLAEAGYKRVMVGVGGSASNDGGLGMAAGLGYEFFDISGHKLQPLGSNLGKVARISDAAVPNQIKELELTLITDVTNPLCGPQGATYVFAAQKGLAEADFAQVDRAMESFYQLVNPTVFELAGAGAGGGMGAGLVTFAGGRLVSGIDAILDLLDFDQKVKEADLVIVGEGRMDRQSLAGKAPIGVARRTPAGIPVIAVCGSLREDLLDFPVENIVAAFPIISKVDSLENTLASAYQNLERTACNIGNLLALSQGK
uniref:glycerate kinase family protein n=1 Tax=Streptococcus sobrinus TaxID=1310 RepID=UPI00038016C0